MFLIDLRLEGPGAELEHLMRNQTLVRFLRNRSSEQLKDFARATFCRVGELDVRALYNGITKGCNYHEGPVYSDEGPLALLKTMSISLPS